MVPTQYKSLYGEVSFANQYSVSEKIVSIDQLGRSEALSGLFLRDFRGVIVTYDFHPVTVPNIKSLCAQLMLFVCDCTFLLLQVMLLMEERREKIVDFVSNLFGIVGGVIAVLR